MNSNVYSTEEASPPPVQPIGLDQLEAAIQDLCTQDLHALPDGVAAARVLALRRLLDRLEGHWLRELAGVDGRGAAGSEADTQVLSTTSWLRNQLRLGAGAARRAVHTSRALFRGPLAGTAHALAAGEVSVAHAAVLAAGTADLPAHTTMEAEPVLLQAARRLDPHRLRRVVNHLRYVTDPDRAEQQQQRRFERRGVWLSPTWEGMLAVDGLLDPEAGQTLLAALEPLARPAGTDDERSGTQRNADALAELARRSLKHGSLPQSGGVRPQLLVTVDLDSLLGRPGPGGELGWTGSLGAEACRRIACDGALTRVLVTRQPATNGNGNGNGGGAGGLAARLQAAIRLLPPVLGGAPTQPLEVGRTSRTVLPAQRNALVVRDGGCAFPGCDRPRAGARPTTCATGHTAGRPTWATWPCCAGRIIGPSTRAAGGCGATPTGG